ncbi:hypothetical protein TWF751_003125 [Orbilia oligospora]|nr:hypothetical protein TWF751_003125 [Orbilia oligospora]
MGFITSDCDLLAVEGPEDYLASNDKEYVWLNPYIHMTSNHVVCGIAIIKVKSSQPTISLDANLVQIMALL